MGKNKSIQFTTAYKYNLAGFRDFIIIKNKIKIIICCVMIVLLIPLIIFQAIYHPLHGIARVIYAILLVFPACTVGTLKHEYDEFKDLCRNRAAKKCIFSIYDDKLSFRLMEENAEAAEVSMSDITLRIKEKREYYLIYTSKRYGVIQKDCLSEDDKNAVAELIESINGRCGKGLKAIEGSGC